MKIDQIIRSQRKSLALIIENDGRLVVRAPYKLPVDFIQRYVDEHAAWVEEKRAWLRDHPQQVKPTFQNGERYYYLGQPLRLELLSDSGRHKPLCFIPAEKGKEAILQLAISKQLTAEKQLSSWYMLQAALVFNVRAATLAEEHGLHFTHLRISSARRRWGSYSSKGTLSLAWRLVMLPPEIIDYVILHELVHSLEANHSPRFWARLEARMPDYKARRKWLKEHGQKMVY